MEEARLVGSFPDQKMKRTVSLADTTSQIDLVLWRVRAEKINFKGDVLRLDNMVASKFNGQLNMTTSFESSIEVGDEEMTAAKATKRRSSNVI